MAEQQINSQIQTNNEELTNTITLHDIIRMVIANWYWFVLSTVCCLCAAYYYLASTPKIYSRTATILVKDSRKGGDVDLTAFSDLAGFQNRRNVDNEVFILQSRRLMTNVVKQLNLTVNYSVSDGLRRRDLYGQAPIDVKFINDNDNQSLAMEITPIDDDKIRLSEFKDQFVTKHESRSVITAAYGDTIPTPVGQVVVQKSLYMAPDYIGVPIRVTKSSLGRTTNAYRAAVKSDVANKQASVVTISMNNTVPRRAEDVINTLIEAYNEDAIEDKRRGRYGQVHQGPSGRYRTRAGRRGPQYRGHQEGQPDGGHHLGGRAQRVGKFALQDGRSFARKPDQRGGVHPHLPERPEKRR